MRVPILLLCSAFTLGHVHAQSLSEADREALLENLEKLRESADSKVDAKFRVALSAYSSAIGSDDAAITLYLNCMEKVNFENQNRKQADFRDWKRKEADRLSDPALRLALRHQLRWLTLTLRAASEQADREKLVPEAQEIVDAIFRDSEKIGSQEGLLNQPVTSSVFAQAYEINGVKLENWPLSPIQLDQVYEQILLPPYRTASRVSELRSAWTRRIQQESQKVEYWGENPAPRGATQSPRVEKFFQETSPRLQWNMEMDLFRNGDESGSAMRMLAHLEKYIAHPSAREWSDQLRALLKPAAKAAAQAN